MYFWLVDSGNPSSCSKRFRNTASTEDSRHEDHPFRMSINYTDLLMILTFVRWSAVVRGAVARGLEPDGEGLVDLRKCRVHYGTPVSVEFDSSIHDPSDAYTDEFTGRKMAKGRLLQRREVTSAD